ncbi:MAG: alpha/beta hydrolase [Polyangiaceae bacterium]|nr:alpha/beta hydrolase [Polyangiaceae bacterium]
MKEPREEQVHDVNARGVRLRVAERGSGPSLLLLHDFLMNRRGWEGVAGLLAGQFRVVTPDLPGFGDSEKPSVHRFDYGVEAFAECVADLIAAMGLGRTCVVGHGLSGAVALALATRHPEFVDRLTLVDPLVYAPPQKSGLFEMPVLGAFFFKQLYGRALFRAYFRDQVFSPGFAVPLARIDQFYDTFNAPSARESAFATMHAFLDTRPTVARLGRVQAPSFIVWGRMDGIYPCQYGQRLARELNGARLEVMETGHAPHLEQPERFVEVLSDFLGAQRR